MAKVIHKYPVSLQGDTPLPCGAGVLHIGLQKDALYLWAEVCTATSNEIENRVFRLYGTGRPLPEDTEREYMSTVFDGPFVWHIYEELK